MKKLKTYFFEGGNLTVREVQEKFLPKMSDMTIRNHLEKGAKTKAEIINRPPQKYHKGGAWRRTNAAMYPKKDVEK